MEHSLPAIMNNNFSLIQFIDLSKAFDCVHHKILLAKLHRYGIRDDALRLMTSYLSNRRQRVKVKGSFSKYTEVEMGVPQGSCLGPLLYIIYANDLDNLFDDMRLVTYADDITLTINGDDVSELISSMNSALSLILYWTRFNLIPVNIKKCEAILVSNKRHSCTLPIMIDNNKIEIVTQTKYLGVHIDHKLTFCHHLDYINSKLSQLCGITWKITYKLNINSARTFYYSFIFSLIEYGIASWGGVLLTYSCNRTINLYRRVIQNLFSWHFPGKTFEELCVKLNFLCPVDIYKLSITTLYFFSLNTDTLPRLDFDRKVCFYNYRADIELEIPFPRTRVVKAHYIYQIPMLWNNVPKEIRDGSTTLTFKNRYKKFLLKEFAEVHG